MKKNSETKPAEYDIEKMEDIQKLVHLLQVHQVELEHQNQELRIAQEELEVSRNKYVNLFDFSPIPYFTLNRDGIIKEVNLSASKMLGVERRKIIGKQFSKYILQGEREIYNSCIKNIFNSAEKYSCELVVINTENQEFNILLEGLQLENHLEQEANCQIALIDLTEYKSIEENLKKSSQELKLLNSTKDKFFSIIAHDLRSPFQSLLSSSECLATDIDILSQDEIMIFSKELNNSLKKLYRLLENLLNWSLMQRKLLENKPTNNNLYIIVKKAIGILNQIANKKKITLFNKISKDTFVYADPAMLSSIIYNLITNALKFTKYEGKVIVSSIEKYGFIEVSVEDNGVGMEHDKSFLLFDFTNLFSTNGTEGETGTGLGLPLCKEFVEIQGGKIWVESKHGKGSKFSFSLPKSIPIQ